MWWLCTGGSYCLEIEFITPCNFWVGMVSTLVQSMMKTLNGRYMHGGSLEGRAQKWSLPVSEQLADYSETHFAQLLYSQRVRSEVK